MGITLGGILAVGAGSCIGGILRYLLSRVIQCHSAGAFPWGTLAVNLLGCLILGGLYGAIDNNLRLSEAWRLFLTVGVCGGFTTFSTFAGETYKLLSSGNTAISMVYAMLTLILGVILLWVGAIAGQQLTLVGNEIQK